eukprot:5028064-Amphidinium_carterae.1
MLTNSQCALIAPGFGKGNAALRGNDRHACTVQQILAEFLANPMSTCMSQQVCMRASKSTRMPRQRSGLWSVWPRPWSQAPMMMTTMTKMAQMTWRP